MGQPRVRWANSKAAKKRSARSTATRQSFGAGFNSGRQELTPTELTADTCCALGVHSQWCGCEA